jgi:predicted CoA-binding protein
MSSDTATDDLVREILGETRLIALVGASPDTSRDSHDVMRFLLRKGFRVIPVNPNYAGEQILGQTTVPTLADIAEPIDMVDIFRRSDAAGEVVDEAIEAGAKAVWMQLRVINEEAAERARKAGLKVVMNRCPKVEMPRLGIPGPAER